MKLNKTLIFGSSLLLLCACSFDFSSSVLSSESSSESSSTLTSEELESNSYSTTNSNSCSFDISSSVLSSESLSEFSSTLTPEEIETNYSIAISNKSITLIEDVKTSDSFTVSTAFLEATSSKGTVTLKSLDEHVATVDQAGNVSFVGYGSCNIEASWEINGFTFKDTASVECYSKVTAENLNTFSSDYLLTQGRTYLSSNYLALDLPATGFDIGFYGTEFKFTVKGNNTHSYLHTYLDNDAEGNLVNIDSMSDKEFTLYQDLENGFHTLRVIKATSYQYGRVYISKFNENGTYFKAPSRNLTIEFLGDSISCGYGNLGTPAQSGTYKNEDAGQAFPYLTSKELDANFSVLALEGICAKDGGTNIYDYYDNYSFADSKTIYDCASYNADVVVIGLGENDMWHATDNSFAYTTQKFEEDYASLINLVRSYHPDSLIVCMYGMMTASSSVAANNCIQTAITNSGDPNICSLKVKYNNKGCETHPNVAGHKAFTEKLVELIQEKLTADNSPAIPVS